ncbi:hypothetical protein [Brevibacillus sp. MER 51]|uniref:hypothetical protein n=1 Tax=Brevibacillus sp. MER 51 TaxID=2939560 RepID=UPI0020409333|nr:hypothetical protein [Brevibacillus sp. MER 51]MCM3144350.1 hypothetical protein [Brevibacillus sp. MER 51]
MEVKTYPEMNARIKEILRLSDFPTDKYAANRIEELEVENSHLLEREKKLIESLKKIAYWQYPGRLIAEETLKEFGIDEEAV